MTQTCPHVPELDRAIIAAGDHKLVIELQTRDSRLVFVGTWEITDRGIETSLLHLRLHT